jgi:hypothetical protein
VRLFLWNGERNRDQAKDLAMRKCRRGFTPIDDRSRCARDQAFSPLMNWRRHQHPPLFGGGRSGPRNIWIVSDYAAWSKQSSVDGRARGKHLPHCKYGHEYTPENSFMKERRRPRCRICRTIRKQKQSPRPEDYRAQSGIVLLADAAAGISANAASVCGAIGQKPLGALVTRRQHGCVLTGSDDGHVPGDCVLKWSDGFEAFVAVRTAACSRASRRRSTRCRQAFDALRRDVSIEQWNQLDMIGSPLPGGDGFDFGVRSNTSEVMT